VPESDNLKIRIMKKTRISVTKAARNFADCVNRAHYQGLSFVLVKNDKAVAQLVPDNEKACFGRDAAKALAKVKLSPAEAKAWRRDLKAARKILKPPTDKWG
jgi:antitoxin (DNA-binding transcriptional repressor) of toxin-antitoxin stability system